MSKPGTKPAAKQAAKPTARANTFEDNTAPFVPPKRTAAISLPSISLKDMEEGDSLYFRALAEIEDKPDLDKNGQHKMDADTGKAQYLHLLRIENLQTKQIGEIVLGFIPNKDLKAMAERGEPYIGQTFELQKGEKKGRTNMWALYKLAD